MAGRKRKAASIKRRSSTSALDFDEKLNQTQMAWVQQLAAAHTEEAIHGLVEVATATRRELIPDENGWFAPVKDEETGETITLPYLPGPRTTAAKALLDHAHGRPTQRVQHDGNLGSASLTVVLQTFGPNGESKVIDVTPTPERIGGENHPAERVET